MLIDELLGCPLQQITRSYWAVKLDDDSWISEAHEKCDLVNGERRLTDWSKDIVNLELNSRIRELWLLCPPNHLSPLGNTAMFPITTPGTAFQFKVGTASSNLAETRRQQEAHIIGRVINSAGECECFVWDAFYQVLGTDFKTTIFNFGTWRAGIPPRGPLSLAALGVIL